MTIDLEKYRQKNAHHETMASVRYSPTGKFLATADRGGKINLWQSERIRVTRSVRSPFSTLTGVWFSEDESWLLAGHEKGNIVVYGLPDLKILGQVALKTNRSGSENILAGATPVLDWVILITSPADDPNFYAVLEFCDFFTIRRKDFQVLSYKHIDRNPYCCGAGVLDGRTLFLGDDLGYVMRFNVPEMTLKMFSTHRETVKAFDLARRPTTMETTTGIANLTLSGNQFLIASTSRSGGAQIWEAQAPELQPDRFYEREPLFKKAPAESGWMRGACFLADQTEVLLGTDDGKITKWDYKGGGATAWAQCSESIRSMDAAPGGGQVAIGGEDGGLFIIPLPGSQGAHPSDKSSSGRLQQLFGKRKTL